LFPSVFFNPALHLYIKPEKKIPEKETPGGTQVKIFFVERPVCLPESPAFNPGDFITLL